MLAKGLIQTPAFGQGGAAIVPGPAQHQDKFATALVGVGVHPGLNRAQAVSQDGFEQFGQFAGQDRLALRSENGDEIGQ